MMSMQNIIHVNHNIFRTKMSAKMSLVLFLTIILALTPAFAEEEPRSTNDQQVQAQEMSMKRTACLVLSRYHSNTRKQQIEEIFTALDPQSQNKFVNKMYSTAVELCLPKITMDEAQKFFIEDPTFNPEEMFYIYDGFSYSNIDIETPLTKNQEAIVKFMKTFDEEMAVRREEKEAQKGEGSQEESFDMKFFGFSFSSISSSTKLIYLAILASGLSGALYYLFSRLDDGKKKQKSKKKKSPPKAENKKN